MPPNIRFLPQPVSRFMRDNQSPHWESSLTFEFYLHSKKLWDACGYQEEQKCRRLQILIVA